MHIIYLSYHCVEGSLMVSYLECLMIKLLLKCLYRLHSENSLQELKFIIGHILQAEALLQPA